ncbi:Fic family protein [Methanospirillum sp.]|uniref:Fic family protein n=1 Tax=Methanospirillum sp. TaxID=45200 RepID=UPI00345CAFFC
MNGGFVEMTQPDSSKSPNQKYRFPDWEKRCSLKRVGKIVMNTGNYRRYFRENPGNNVVNVMIFRYAGSGNASWWN